METQPGKSASDRNEAKNTKSRKHTSQTGKDSVEEDGTPVLDEEDLEENDIDDDAVDDIEWEDPKA